MDKFLFLFGQVILESSFADLALQLSPVLCRPQLSLCRSPKLSRIQVHIYFLLGERYFKKTYQWAKHLKYYIP
jgi:hypothetical protein